MINGNENGRYSVTKFLRANFLESFAVVAFEVHWVTGKVRKLVPCNAVGRENFLSKNLLYNWNLLEGSPLPGYNAKSIAQI